MMAATSLSRTVGADRARSFGNPEAVNLRADGGLSGSVAVAVTSGMGSEYCALTSATDSAIVGGRLSLLTKVQVTVLPGGTSMFVTGLPLSQSALICRQPAGA